MGRDDPGWGVRFADVRVSRYLAHYWPFWILAMLLMVLRRDRKMVREGDRIGRDIAESVVKRWRETDERTDALIDLTRALKRLTWVLLLVALATLGVAVWALVHG